MARKRHNGSDDQADMGERAAPPNMEADGEDTGGTPVPPAATEAEIVDEAPIAVIEESNRCMVVTRSPMQVGDVKCPAGTVIGFLSTTPPPGGVGNGHTPEFVAHCVARGIAKVIPVCG